MKPKIILLIVLAFAQLLLTAEEPNNQFQSMKFEYLNIDNGLSHNCVQCIFRDYKGYLWVGTNNGLNKYDGLKVIHYKNNATQKSSISGNNIECIYEDRNHNLWIGTTLGLNLYIRETDSFIQYFFQSDSDQNPPENDNRVFSIVEDFKGNIWCSTINGLNKWNPTEKKFTKYNIPATINYYNANNVGSMALDENGFLWLGAQDNRLWRLNVETLQFDSFSDPLLNSLSGLTQNIIRDKSGIIWIGTYGKGLYSYHPSTRLFQHFNTEGNGKGTHGHLIKELFLDGNRYLYASVDLGGMTRIDLQTMTFEYCLLDENIENGLNSNLIQCVYKDSEDILYAGTSVAGLNIHNPKKNRFNTYRHSANYENSLISNAVFKFFEDSQGLIWIGTDGGGLSVFDPKKKSFKNFRHNPSDQYSLSRNSVLAITEDKNHDIWLGTWGAGLNRFDRKTGRFYHFMPDTARPEAISNENIWDLFTDRKGNIWISYGWVGIDVFDIRKGVFRKYRFNAADSALFCPLNTNRFILQTDGKMGFATNKGYFILDSISNRLQKFKPFKDNDLTDVYVDKQGNYWAGTTNNGMFIAKADGKIEQYNESNGLKSNSISGFLEDQNGNIWILTSLGLAKYKFESKQFRFFDFSNGLQGRLFSNFARLKAKDGSFYIGGFNGFNEFHPEDIKDNGILPSVYIDEFRIFNEPVPIDTLNSPLKQSITTTKEIVLSHKQSVFSFGFTALNFTYPENAKYAYKMEGYDEKWNYTNSDRRYVSYTNLDAGEYTFMVKATNNDGIWNEIPTSLKITITPPIWKTWWFKTLAALFILGSILSFYFWRVNNLKYQKSVLELKVKERTATLQKANITLEENREEILMQRDTLELKNSELEDKTQEIIHITNLLHESDQMKIRFFTNISHDLRTPLTLILGYMESIISGITTNSKLFDRLAIVTNNANRLLRLVNQLLDFQKIDAESLKFQAEYQDIALFIRNIFDSFSLQAEKRQIEYRLKTEIEIYSTWFDPDKLDKILFNLLSNAFKFTPDRGKITLELDINNINSVDKKVPETLIIRVTDSGIGIQEQDLNRIFDRFYQVDNSSFRNYKGSGIGLALTKHLVEIHGGIIHVTSQPQVGSCFEVILSIGESMQTSPIVPDESVLSGSFNIINVEPSEKIIEIPTAVTEGSTILVVEDNDELRHFICDELAQKYRIIEATNGKEGLELAISEQPDLVVSDVMMPYMDGFEMCEKLKLEWQTSHIPIIILTAKSDEESFYHGIEIGADAYIRKPFHLKHLLIQVGNLLANRRKLFEKYSKNPLPDFELHSQNSGDHDFLEKLYQVIENHIDDNNFGVEELASQVNMSRTLLYKRIFSTLNISVGELIRTLRLKKAAVLLMDQKNSVTDVAGMVGFADRPQFSRSFTNLYGLSPKQFQVQGNNQQQKGGSE